LGYYSVITVLHDQLSGITDHPKEFTKDLYRAVCGFQRGPHASNTIRGGGGYANPASLIAQDHSDVFHMLVTGGNTGWDLGICGNWSVRFRDDMDELERKVAWLRRIADSVGYRLVKK